jgi:hypothetical protein
MPSTHLLTDWAGFYTITGSAAAALTGLMFVVMTLMAGGRSPARRESISTFSTPTVVHFSVALITAAILTVPWNSLIAAGIALAIPGFLGIGYSIRAIRAARRQEYYKSDLEDWAWYAIVPLVVYVLFVGAAVALAIAPNGGMFVVGFCELALLFVGIRNSWDVVTYIAVELDLKSASDAKPADPPREPAASPSADRSVAEVEPKRHEATNPPADSTPNP